MLAGPILRYQNFREIEADQHREKKSQFYCQILFAFLLKIVLVDGILYYLVYDELIDQISADTLEHGRGSIIAFAFLSFLHAYFDLMLYTEMSKGVAGALGFTNQENFNRPLLATNISQFWQRWHMSLSDWTRDYVFFPFLIKTKNTWLSTYASMLTIGVWHSASLNWIVWALCHGTLINVYGNVRATKFFKTAVKRVPLVMGLFGNLFTISFVSFVFIFVALHDFDKACRVIARLFTG